MKHDYQIAFIKLVISELERRNTEEIHDVIYEQLTLKLEAIGSEFSFKHFILAGDEDCITIKESNSFIRDGTTGLKLWPAAMALGEFIIQNSEIFNGNSILELGSGATGFVGMVLIKTCKPSKVYISDCHDAVIETLIENVNRNLMSQSIKNMEKSLFIRQRLKINDELEFGVLNLPWEDTKKIEEELKTVCKPKVIIAADVIYDDTIFDALISCLTRLFENSEPSTVFFLSQTVRNIETYQKFCNLLIEGKFIFSEVELKQTRAFNWQSKSEIKILRISKRR